jgi:hypothetical protein
LHEKLQQHRKEVERVLQDASSEQIRLIEEISDIERELNELLY